MQTIPQASINAILSNNIDHISQVLQDGSQMSAGWELPSDFIISCLQVNGDQDTFNECPFAQDFIAGRSVQVTCSAILLVPGKAIIGIASIDDQDVEDRVPHFALMTNDYKNRGLISSFVRAACTSGGPFSGVISTLKTGGKIQKPFRSANVKMGGRDSTPIVSHLIILEEPFEIDATTHIQQ